MRLKTLSILIGLTSILMVIVACDAITPHDDDLVEYSCEGCHSSKSTLTRVIDALHLEPEDHGEEAPG